MSFFSAISLQAGSRSVLRVSSRNTVSVSNSRRSFASKSPMENPLEPEAPVVAAGEKKSMSYYKVMNGIKYERSSIEMATAVIEKRGDKPIPVVEAKEIANSLSDGQGVTKIEFRTAFKILADFKFTKEAQTVFIKIMSEAS